MIDALPILANLPAALPEAALAAEPAPGFAALLAAALPPQAALPICRNCPRRSRTQQ